MQYRCGLYATLLCTVNIDAIVIHLWRFTLKPIILISCLLFCLAATADEAAVELGASSTPGIVDNSGQAELAAKLDRLAQSLGNQRDEIKLINIQLSTTEDEAERKSLQKKLSQLHDRETRYQVSLEQLVIGGIDTSILHDDAPEQVAWQDEIQDILLPLLASLKELTAKPRRIEALRTQIHHQEQRLDTVQEALISINTIADMELAEKTRESISAIPENWQALESEISQNLDLSRAQLNNVLSEKVAWAELLSDIFNNFLRERGITILLAVTAGAITWLVLGGIFSLYMRLLRSRHAKSSRTRLRLIQFIHTGISVALAIIAVVSVFYFRSDILLFTLSVILVVFFLISLRQTLPQYIREARLLLNIGAVREGERLLINGTPFEVQIINIYCVFHNPKLRGILRLPLSKLDGMESRPSLESESWFPTSREDVVFLSNDAIAQVEFQSVDFVQLRLVGSTMLMATADFIAHGVRNLTRDGFGIPVIFGIDYQHQDIVLTQVPGAFREGIEAALAEANLLDSLHNLSVELAEAASNSLDMRIYGSFDGAIAIQYYSLRRLITRACVLVCNENHWVIPFTQLTLHQGQGFEQLSAAKTEPALSNS